MYTAFAQCWSASLSTSPASSTTKRILVTGTNAKGIRGETVLALARAYPDLELYLCARDERKASEVATAARAIASSNINVHILPLDLGSLESTRKCARLVQDTLDGKKLDVAIMNAGVMACPLMYTKDGVEYQYGVNHLAHALLYLSLQNYVDRSVFVSSLAVSISSGRKKPPLIGEKVMGGFLSENYARWKAYGDSKLAMSMFARGLALTGNKETVSLHPGIVNTELQRYILPEALMQQGSGPLAQFFGLAASKLFRLKTPQQGAESSLRFATDELGNFESGALYIDKVKKAPKFTAPLLYDDEQCNVVLNDTIQFLEKFTSDTDGSDLALEKKQA